MREYFRTGFWKPGLSPNPESRKLGSTPAQGQVRQWEKRGEESLAGLQQLREATEAGRQEGPGRRPGERGPPGRAAGGGSTQTQEPEDLSSVEYSWQMP